MQESEDARQSRLPRSEKAVSRSGRRRSGIGRGIGVDRVRAACDLCKVRKVKCDGSLPCGYCQRKERADTCTFSGPKPTKRAQQAQQAQQARPPSTQQARPPTPHISQPLRAPAPQATHPIPTPLQHDYPTSPTPLQDDYPTSRTPMPPLPSITRDDPHQDTDVPLEARLLCDAHGKVIFIGDCAPLSFLQTVRHLISSEVELDPTGATNQLSRHAVVELAPLRALPPAPHGLPRIRPSDVPDLVTAYSIATCGLVHLFEHSHFKADLLSWATRDRPAAAAAAAAAARAVYYLVAAIGVQETDEATADAWFCHAKDLLLDNLTSSMSVATVQGFALVAIYMLRAFQPNGAYLYFSLAARTAYAIGLHRTEVNASTAMPGERDRIWKSLRVVDMLISNMLGRPPSTSDVDCTVKYGVQDAVGDDVHMFLDASTQIFMIIERVVVEVYSQKRISLRIATFVSHQLKAWAAQWVRQLTAIVDRCTAESADQEGIVGACQTLSSYYYSIMLLTRPFLIYELYEYLGATLRGQSSHAENQQKRKFADAALDAAVAFVDVLHRVLAVGRMPHRMPLVVSWLFTAALVLAVGVVGRSGLMLQGSCNTSIKCLEYFASIDPHAQQYATAVRAILATTVDHVKNREKHLQRQRKQASSELFGLLCKDTDETDDPSENAQIMAHDQRRSSDAPRHESVEVPGSESAWTYYDADFLALPWLNENDQGLQDFLQPGRQTLEGSMADIPLFPLYDQTAGPSE